MLIGIPLVQAAFGDAGIVYLIVIVAVHLPVMMLVSVLLNEWALSARRNRERGRPARDAIRRLASSLATHPILIGIAAGLLWRG